ncbi:hypothetical protein L204_103777 [Cryptococcus depauperatus]|nr:hypothetical protein L204_02934 [Cryptococcus depauperatus CBS 7855]
MSGNNTNRERLDIESPEDRKTRLGSLMTNISKSIPQQTSPINSLSGRPQALPESDVLSRVRAFLPRMQKSNDELLAQALRDPNSVNMENGQEEQYIAMNLELGVFDAPQNPSGDMGPVVETKIPEGLQRDSDRETSSEKGSSSQSSSSESDSEVESDSLSTKPSLS